MPRKLRVALVGGSISGCTLANGLLKHPHIDFHVFESRASFTETGASVGLAANAMNSLKAIGIDVDRMRQDSGATSMSSTRYFVGYGKYKGECIFELPAGVISVTRQGWLRELLRKIPPERLHPSKKLVSIIEPQDENTPYALHFEDGDTYHADAVIGCDGIHSKVRQFVLDSTCPALCGGYWNTAGKLPRQQALARFGPDLLSPSDPKEVALIGEGASVLFVPTENGEVYHVIVAGMADPEQHPSSWKMAVERSYLETALRQWDVKMREALVETLVPSPNGTCTILSHFESSDTPSYIRNRACIIGDAAHATIPWLGQGACMATEDAAVLSSLLGLADSTTALKIALKSFDATRRGRPELVMSLSHQAAMILTGQRGLNPESIEQFHAPQWWSEFWSLDADAHIQVAVDRFHQLSAQIA